MQRPSSQPPTREWLDRARARAHEVTQPEQQRFSLLYRGRPCRVYRTFEAGATEVQIQFEDGHTAVVSRAEVMSPDGNDRFQGPDVRRGDAPASLPTLIIVDVPAAETPAQHVRNALQVLMLLQEESPAFWAMNAELQRAAVHATAALVVLEHGGTAALAQLHLRRATESLLAAAVDWEIVVEVPAACGRLLAALFAVDPDADGPACCLRCGGTVLAPAIGGVPRGSCHCPRDRNGRAP